MTSPEPPRSNEPVSLPDSAPGTLEATAGRPPRKRAPRGLASVTLDSLRQGMRGARTVAAGKVTMKSSVLPSPAPLMSAAEIRGVREKLKVSQAMFGRLLNVPLATVLKWEHGKRKPSGAALRLLEIAGHTPGALLPPGR